MAKIDSTDKIRSNSAPNIGTDQLFRYLPIQRKIIAKHPHNAVQLEIVFFLILYKPSYPERGRSQY